MKSKELSNYLERLRAARNISQESFTNGITSLRQYRRYLSGESDLPFQVIDKLCERLGIQTINLIRELETARIEESKAVDAFYNDVIYNNKERIDKTIKEYHGKTFIDIENRLMYEHSIIINDYFNQKITSEVATQKNKELIHFDKIGKKLIFTQTEMLILTSLLDLNATDQEKSIIAQRLKTFLTDSSQVLNASVNFALPIVLFRLAKYWGTQSQYNEVIAYTELAINHGLSIKNCYLLEYFFYYNALASYRLGNFDQYEMMLSKCFVVLQLDGNKRKIEKFTNMINEDFNISFQDFVFNYFNKKSTS